MLDYDPGCSDVIGLLERIELLEPVFLPYVARDLGQERNRKVSEVCLCLDCVVKHSSEEVECERDAASEHERCEEDHHLVRCHRIVGTVRVHDHAGVADIDEGCEFVLLTLLEEEDVEVLGDLLLTLYGEELEFLS